MTAPTSPAPETGHPFQHDWVGNVCRTCGATKETSPAQSTTPEKLRKLADDRPTVADTIVAILASAQRASFTPDGHLQYWVTPKAKAELDKLVGEWLCGPIAGRPNIIERAEAAEARLAAARAEAMEEGRDYVCASCAAGIPLDGNFHQHKANWDGAPITKVPCRATWFREAVIRARAGARG